MTEGSEPRTHPPATSQVETVGSRTVGKPAARRGGWWRLRVILTALIAVALASWGVPHLRAVFDDGMRGPYGRFPQPVAAQPPVHSANRVASAPRDTVIYSGLAIMPAGDGVRAVDIVTGKVYWRYTKSKSAPVGVDRSTGEVFLRSTSGDLVKITIRSGKIRWSRKMPDIDSENSISTVPDADTATLALMGSDGIAGISRATGKTRWKQKWPDTCPYESIFARVAVLPGTLVVACNDYDAPDKAVVGFDPATGATRWALHASQLFGPPRSGTMVDAVGVVNGRLAVAAGDMTDILDPATGRIVTKRRWKDRYAAALDDGLQVSLCKDKKGDAICGIDPAAGRELWRTPIPDSGHLPQANESLAVADGRVYIVSFVSKNESFELVVLDGRTGRILGRNPTGEENFIYGPVTDGIVVIGVTTDNLYAERPDIQSPRRLP
ncbi:Outer membrane protein assembly factor BamB [Actinomadura sp. RB99]|uniref:outer membrane protein assembly factor BamB family protein n=1 Tax=Actinomadura sp. RB99 TaxID=2691577 RepID=UPI0016838A20|nr:PQQ-binding-like beta-propeller repeat protein [Actinomadura sp. RB99]MBD2897844.1 Outer membrane protein assembly factor BamB [Actinomadura sp. RB99]